MITLDHALERLLTRRDDRRDFFAGGDLGLEPSILDALRAIDRGQLEATARSIVEHVRDRRHLGSGTLGDLFPATIQAWRDAHPEDAELLELFSRFVESDAYVLWSAHPPAGIGRCLEDAFFIFCESIDLGDPATREHEHLSALLKALALNPRPQFTLPPEVTRTSGGGFAVSTRRDPPHLHAASAGRLIQGPLTPFLAELIIASSPAEEIAARHGVGAAVLTEALAQLAALGVTD